MYASRIVDHFRPGDDNEVPVPRQAAPATSMRFTPLFEGRRGPWTTVFPDHSGLFDQSPLIFPIQEPITERWINPLPEQSLGGSTVLSSPIRQPGATNPANAGNARPGFMPMFNNDNIIERRKSSGEAGKKRQENIDKGLPESILGPSGKPKIHVVDHSTKKRATEDDVNSTDHGLMPEHHPRPTKGKPHFHPGGKAEHEHHTYPGKGFPGSKRY